MERRRGGSEVCSGGRVRGGGGDGDGDGEGDGEGEVEEEDAGSFKPEECAGVSVRPCKFAADAALSNVRDVCRRVDA